MKKRHFLWLTLIVLLLVLFGVTVYAQVADNTMTINASPISPYHIATGLPYRISSMFDFSSVPDGYHLSNVEFDFDTNPEAADFIRIEKVGSYNSTEFYLICTEDSLHGTAPLYLNFTFTNGTDTLNESGTVYLTFDGSSFLGTTFSSQGTSDDTALMFSDGMSIYMYPTVSDTAPLTLYFNDNIENCLTQNGFNYSDSYEYYLMLKAESDPQNPIPSDKGVKKSNESVSAYGFQFPEDSGVFREILQRDYTIWLEVLEKEEGLTTQTILMPTGFTIKKLFNVKSIDHDKLIAGRKHDSFQYESGIPEFNLNVEWDRETINETENKLVLTTDGKVIPIVHSLEHPLTLEGKYKPQKNGSDLNLAEELVTFSVSIGSIESPVKALNDSVTIPMDEFTKIFTLDLPKKGDRDYAGYELDDISVKLNGEDAKDAFEITVEN